MKRTIAGLFIVVLFAILVVFQTPMFTNAQVPLTPWYLATASCNPLVAGCPLQVGPMPGPYVPPAPTWTPLPPVVLPTATPQGQYQVRVLSYEMLYVQPARQLFVPITLIHIGETFTVRPVDAYWVQILDGWAASFYVETWGLQRL